MKYGEKEARQFVTNLSLLTSNGRWGHNVMTAEWVHHVSYSPAIVMVNVHEADATSDNIIGSGEFGVSVVPDDMIEPIGIAGRSTGKKTDKVAALRELGMEFYKAGKIDVYMVKGAVMNLECRLIRHEVVGDHVMFMGEVVDASVDEGKSPAIFRSGTGVYKVGERLAHERSEAREKEIGEALARHAKKAD